VFEKNDRIGGRIRDISLGPNPDDVYGSGGYRLYDGQYTNELATELGVTVQAPYDFAKLFALQDPDGVSGRKFGYSGDALKGLYSQTDNDDDMWVKLLCGDQVPKTDGGFPDYTGVDGGVASKSSLQYVKDVLGDEGAKFFFDMNRFRADFVDDVDAIGYMQYGMIDYFGPTNIIKYPIPGHSALMNKMKSAAEGKGARFFLSDPVSDVSSKADGTFTLTTKSHSVSAKQVILAAPPGALGKIGGDVIASLKSQKEFNNVTSAKSMQVTQTWDKDWWKGDLRYNGADLQGAQLDAVDAGGKPVLRADTTIMSNGACINSIEMPPTAHHDGLHATRTVYSDNRTCVDKNIQLYGSGGTAGETALNTELLTILRALFPAIFDGSGNEPKITKTDVNVHEEAWFYLKKGATTMGVTNKSVFDWASNPVAGKKVYLVGDAWYPLGSGWSNAAYITSIRTLNDHFGFSMASHELQPVACP